MYRVESILDKKIQEGGQVLYKIKWENYPVEQSTWEPLKNLKSVRSMVKDFQMKYGKKNTYKPKTAISRIEPKIEPKPIIRNQKKSQIQDISQAKGRKMLKKSSNADQKTQPNDNKSSSLEDYYISKEGEIDDAQDIEQFNLSFLSAKIHQLTQKKRSLKIIDMFKGQDNKFFYQVQREEGKRDIESRDYLMNNGYEDQMIRFYQSRVQFKKLNQ